MYRTVTRNLRKRKGGSGTWFLETTTMFAPNEESIAELTFGEAEAIREGRKKRGRMRLLYDHRWGICDDLTDEKALREAIAEAFGDALLWQDLDALVDEFYDTRNTASDSRRFWLNAQTSSQDAWIAAHELDACRRSDRALKPRDLVCLGMDGSITDDSTAVCAVRMSDGHIQLLGVWQKPEGPAGEGWQVDREAVDACIANAMREYEVAGLWCDPAHWQDYVDRWNAQWGAKMRVRASERRPLEFWTNKAAQMVAALERFHEAVLEKRVSFTPSEMLPQGSRAAELAAVLRSHILNARNNDTRAGRQIAKVSHHSPRKIDAAMAAVLAYTAMQDGIAGNVRRKGTTRYPAKRIR